MGNLLSVFVWTCIMDIETKRLLLRPLRDDDAPAIARALKNYDVCKNLARVPFPYTLQDAAAFIALQANHEPRSKTCAIAFKCAPDELIGVVSYEYFALKDQIEFGYWLSECCWHQRLMSEAAAALVKFAFTQTETPALHAGYYLENPVSGRILQGLGFAGGRQGMSFSLAQGKEVPVIRVQLARERWSGLQR
jgi:RimJ/RimL family protein N-acetyltransferase